MKLTIIVPCYNDEQVGETTHKRLLSVIDEAGWDGEILYVDDGSIDGTASMRCIRLETSVTPIIVFSSGVQLSTIGILGIYLGGLLDEVRERPEYIIVDDDEE